MIVFADSWLLWILVPAWLAWVALWIASRALQHGRGRTSAVRFSSLQVLKRLQPSTTLALRRMVQALRLATVALLLLAMARPQTGRTLTEVKTEGIDIILAIDTSGSMQALDLDTDVGITQRKNRLGVVKAVVAEFIEKRKNDQIGMVVFGSEAFTQCPLTLDHGILASFLERVEIGMAGDATAVGSALAIAAKRLKKSKAKSKVIVLLTDGRNNAGSITPLTAAEAAKTYGIKVYTIGAGTRGKAPFLAESIFGRQIVYREEPIDEVTLKRVAAITGGEYQRAVDEDALAAVYERIDELERTEIEMTSYQDYNERFAWLVVPALFLLLLELVLLSTRFRKIP